MKVISIVIKCDSDTLRVLKSRGMFSDDPQWLFNAHMVLANGREMRLNENMHDLLKAETFLVEEEIPYIRILKGGYWDENYN